MKGRILESGEDYLETILILQNRNGEVRSVDIATEMDFSKPSVSVAMKNLREQECITVDKNGYITLTDKGRGIAEKGLRAPYTVYKLAYLYGGARGDSGADACRIEHCLSAESFAAIKRHVKGE